MAWTYEIHINGLMDGGTNYGIYPIMVMHLICHNLLQVFKIMMMIVT